MTATSKKPTARKPATRSRKTPAKDPKVALDEATGDAPETEAAPLKKVDLISAVVTRSGVKKRDAKPVVEAMLEVLGETLAEGRELNLPPLGKVRITKTKEMGAGRLVVARIRQKDRPSVPAKDPLAEAAE